MGKWTIADIPSQSGRTAVITGANSRVGFAPGPNWNAVGAPAGSIRK
jgi:hypothetical protein